MNNTAPAPTPNPYVAPAMNFAGGLIGGIMGFRQQRKQNEANMKMAKYQYSKDLEMWNRGNVYNSPEAQMDRLKKAGLNPALVYGQGAVGNTSAQLPKYNAPTLDYSFVPPVEQTVGGAIDMYQNFIIRQAQGDNLKAQNKILMEKGRILENEADNASRYYSNRGWKIHADRNIADLKESDLWGQLKAKRDYGDGDEEKFWQESTRYQLEAMDASNRAKNKSIEKMQVDMDYKSKQLEFFLVDLLGPHASKALQMLLGRKGGTAPKTPSLNQKKRPTPDYQYNNANRMKNIWPD